MSVVESLVMVDELTKFESGFFEVNSCFRKFALEKG